MCVPVQYSVVTKVNLCLLQYNMILKARRLDTINHGKYIILAMYKYIKYVCLYFVFFY